MSDILPSTRFRREREDDWLRLERLLRLLEQGGARRLTDDELIAAPVLYRAALSSLSVARDTSLDRALVDYLESLCTRAYFVLYGARPDLGARVGRFLREDWPRAAQRLWRPTALAGALMLLGVALGAWLYGRDPDWFYALTPLPPGDPRAPTAGAQALRGVLYDGGERGWMAVFATFLFSHNAQVAVLAFATGFAFGLPTAFLALTNGCSLGALLALYASHGLGVELMGWLLIHGVTELLAVTLACAAGFHLGWTLAFPGARSRADALAEAGRTAATLMVGVVVMLFVAGVLEGVGRQTVVDDAARYAIAGASGLLWLLYLYLPRGRARP